MNLIEMKYRIDHSLDRVNSPRFDLSQYVDAIRKAERRIVNDRIAPIKEPKNYSVERSQRLTEELFTLVVKTNPITPVNNQVPIPADNQYILLVGFNFNGITGYSIPMTHMQLSDVDENPFASPKIPSGKNFNRVKHLTTNTGLELYYGANAGLTDVTISYIKHQAKVSLGKLSDIIEDGGALVIGTAYYILEESEINGITYYPGELINATAALLTTGKLIPAAVVVNSELPERMQDEVCNLAARIMSGDIEDYNKAGNLEDETLKS
jgi:hypothetical protein